MTDKRRINGPPSGTRPPVFASSLPSNKAGIETLRPVRTRQPDELRKIFLKTGLTPSAAGSAYLELQPSNPNPNSLIPSSSSLKITCTVHGPKPLPRSAPYSPNLLLSTIVKFAPFAARRRRGYVRDSGERDLGVHLETALRGAIIAERWPKSGLDVTVTILEAEDDRFWGDASGSGSFSGNDGWGMMNVLAGCITVASAAIADARIDCLDLIAGGVAGFVENARPEVEAASNAKSDKASGRALLLDPNPAEHQSIVSLCVVGYLPSRDEVTELWLKGDMPNSPVNDGDKRLSYESLVDGAVDAARAAHTVLMEAVRESAERFANQASGPPALLDEGTDEMEQ